MKRENSNAYRWNSTPPFLDLIQDLSRMPSHNLSEIAKKINKNKIAHLALRLLHLAKKPCFKIPGTTDALLDLPRVVTEEFNERLETFAKKCKNISHHNLLGKRYMFYPGSLLSLAYNHQNS